MKLFDAVRQEIIDQLKTHFAENEALQGSAEIVLETPPETKMGDFAFPTFRLAKALRKGPPQIAKDLAEKLAQNTVLEKFCSVAPVGPYVNFTIKPEFLTRNVLGALLTSQNRIAEKHVSRIPTVIMEFSSPNVAKPFNIYHLRSTMIGNSLYRIYAARGFDPIAINHLGDWGSQYGTLALAYERWGDDKELETRGIAYLVELYVRINKEMETDPELVKKTREYFARLERGDSDIEIMWKKFVDLSIAEFSKTYKRLGVKFDHFTGESFYIDQVPAVEKLLADKKLLVESEGAQVVNLDAYEMPPCIVRKSDGSTIYATRDLAAAIYRKKTYGFEKCVYVVGGEQRLHFKQVFKVLELAGFEWAGQCEHVDFGLYRFNDAKMSTRKGNFVTMESVLDHAVERVNEIIAKSWSEKFPADGSKGPAPSDEERAEAAEIIGTGAIVFYDLATDRNTDVNFDLERVLDFEGETGPYIQYAHTRCLSILRNAPKILLGGIQIEALFDLAHKEPDHVAGIEGLWKAASLKLKETEELDLIRILSRMPIILDGVIEHSKPSMLATYLLDVTKVFGQFYRAHKVLVDDPNLAKARLGLVLATQRTLLKGLTLLGMRAPKRM